MPEYLNYKPNLELLNFKPDNTNKLHHLLLHQDLTIKDPIWLSLSTLHLHHARDHLLLSNIAHLLQELKMLEVPLPPQAPIKLDIHQELLETLLEDQAQLRAINQAHMEDQDQDLLMDKPLLMFKELLMDQDLELDQELMVQDQVQDQEPMDHHQADMHQE